MKISKLHCVVYASFAVIALTATSHWLHEPEPARYKSLADLKARVDAAGVYTTNQDGKPHQGGAVIISAEPLAKHEAFRAIRKQHADEYVSILIRPELFPGIVYAVKTNNGTDLYEGPNARILGKVYLVGDAEIIHKLQFP